MREQQEASLASDVEFKAGQWIQGTSALISLYSRLDEISKRFRKIKPITISVASTKGAKPTSRVS